MVRSGPRLIDRSQRAALLRLMLQGLRPIAEELGEEVLHLRSAFAFLGEVVQGGVAGVLGFEGAVTPELAIVLRASEGFFGVAELVFELMKLRLGLTKTVAVGVKFDGSLIETLTHLVRVLLVALGEA